MVYLSQTISSALFFTKQRKNIMLYQSTRGGGQPCSFCETLLEGLAPDGGLYMPVEYPQANIPALRTIYEVGGYAALAFAIMSMYIDDIPAEDLRALCNKTYTAKIFGTEKIVPLTELYDHIYLLGLSNGPTLAFKDVALQMLANFFEYQLGRTGQTMNILAATSGDTGSAAEYAMLDKKGIAVFMLSPKKGMSAFQQAQMFSIRNKHIHNIQVAGNFDTCQDLVKEVSADKEFKKKYRIGTVNSINWARLLAQVVYYFAGYFQATASNTEYVNFSIPSGNFGNATSGHVARQMGLPIDKLRVVTNENDVLYEFFSTGIYKPRGKENTYVTSSPSMDISKASNFERFVFDLLGRNAEVTKDLFTTCLTKDGLFDLSSKEAFNYLSQTFGFESARSAHADRIKTMQLVYSRSNGKVMVDTHTADAMLMVNMWTNFGKLIVLETALPIKFDETVKEALGRIAPRPHGFNDPEKSDQRWVENLPARNDPEDLKNMIRRNDINLV